MLTNSDSKTVILLVVFVAWLCLMSTTRAQKYPDAGEPGTGGNNTILGNVFFPSGQRAERRIRVRLMTPTKGDTTTMTTDDGSFSFHRLATGSYTVVIDGEKDYQAVSQSVYIVQATRGGPPGVYTVDIRLKLKDSIETKPVLVDSRLANVPRNALDAYNDALELSKHGNAKGAIEQLKQAVAAYSEFMLAYNELGVQYLKTGDLKNADKSLRRALELAPDAFEPLMNHGITLVRMERYQDAVPKLRQAVKQKEESAVGHFYLGRALAYMGAFEEAEKELSTAIRLGGDEMKDAHRYLAGVYNALGDRPHAIAELETYLRLAPKSPDTEQIRELIRKLRQ